MIIAPLERNFDGWRKNARELLAQEISPQNVHWKSSDGEFIFGEELTFQGGMSEIKLPRDFVEKAFIVSTFRDDSTWALMYKIAWRLLHEDKNLLSIGIDPDVREFESRHQSVRRDLHKMHAFVRFREIKQENESVFMAWHRPDHRILRLAAPFFKDRFNGMNWIIMTEDETAQWNKKELTFSHGVGQHELPPDEKEELWKTYYSSIFNPARVKEKMMKKEMAVRYWNTMPETQLITSLLDSASDRVQAFYEAQTQVPVTKAYKSLEELNLALKSCQACDICPKASAPVPGVGPSFAKIAFIGEQPGNEEDLKGEPFVGPAGQVLMDAFEHVGFKREEVYLSNAVKGFKWFKGYMDRQHAGAGAKEISTCRPWLQNELTIVRPEVLVCLGRSAAQSVLGKAIKLEDERGKFFKSSLCEKTIICPHPASLLRIKDPEERQIAFERFYQEMEFIKQSSVEKH